MAWIDREAREFWKQRRRESLRNQGRGYRGLGGGMPVTMTLLGLLVVGWLVEMVAPQMVFGLTAIPGGNILLLLVSALLPTGLLGLLFTGIFVWMIGPQVESQSEPWQYLVCFFGAGLIGALAAQVAGGFGVASSFAVFGLAGAYVWLLYQHGGRGASMQWALGLLLINVLFSGFNPVALAGMAGAFLAGAIIARVSGIGTR